jgi:Holliday junction resolvase
MKMLREEDVFCYKVHGSELTMAGLPDVVCCVDGKFLGIEVKMPGKKHTLTPRQKHVHRMIVAAGGAVAVVSSVSEARIALEELRRSQRHRVYVLSQTDD